MSKELDIYQKGGFSKGFLKNFETSYPSLREAFETRSININIAYLMMELSKKDERNKLILQLYKAKYIPDAEEKKEAVKEIIDYIDNSLDVNKAPSVEARNDFIDCITAFLPAKNPIFKELHNQIRAWEMSQTSWLHARAESRSEPEL